MKAEFKPVFLSHNEYALEGLFDLPAFSNYITGFFTKFNSVYTDKTLLPLVTPSPLVKKAVEKLSKLDSLNLLDYQVYGPEYLLKDFPGYLVVLDKAFDEFKDVEVNLLVPIENWLSHMISTKDYGKQVWTTLPPAKSKVSEFTNTLHKYLDDSPTDNLHRIPFNTLYLGTNGLLSADALLRGLSDKSLNMLDGKLSKRADSILKLVNILKNKETGNGLEDLPKEKIKYYELQRN
jgi:hypothetical protein